MKPFNASEQPDSSPYRQQPISKTPTGCHSLSILLDAALSPLFPPEVLLRNSLPDEAFACSRLLVNSSLRRFWSYVGPYFDRVHLALTTGYGRLIHSNARNAAAVQPPRERPCSPSRERPSLRGREEREERKRGRERPCSPSRERPSLRGREEREERKRGRERPCSPSRERPSLRGREEREERERE